MAINSIRWFVGLALISSALEARGESALEKSFRDPPPDARPWVYWFWLNGNISSNGITADLEAMKRVGIGGPWIKPEQSMQKVVWSETDFAGPNRFEGALPQPPVVAGFYRDIAVLAFPRGGAYRIDNILVKAGFDLLVPWLGGPVSRGLCTVLRTQPDRMIDDG